MNTVEGISALDGLTRDETAGGEGADPDPVGGTSALDGLSTTDKNDGGGSTGNPGRLVVATLAGTTGAELGATTLIENPCGRLCWKMARERCGATIVVSTVSTSGAEDTAAGTVSTATEGDSDVANTSLVAGYGDLSPGPGVGVGGGTMMTGGQVGHRTVTVSGCGIPGTDGAMVELRQMWQADVTIKVVFGAGRPGATTGQEGQSQSTVMVLVVVVVFVFVTTSTPPAGTTVLPPGQYEHGAYVVPWPIECDGKRPWPGVGVNVGNPVEEEEWETNEAGMEKL